MRRAKPSRSAIPADRLIVEDRLSKKAVAKMLKCSYGTVTRYMLVGFPVVSESGRKLIRLESTKVGGKIETSKEAVLRFLEKINRDS